MEVKNWNISIEDEDAEKVVDYVIRANGLYYGKHITMDEYAAATSHAQIYSKVQLSWVENVDAEVAVYLGSWFGGGPLFRAGWHDTMYCIDLDPKAVLAARTFLADRKDCEHKVADALELSADWYKERKVRLVYNSSVEHFTSGQNLDMLLQMKAGNIKQVVLQSTNMPADDHVCGHASPVDWGAWLERTCEDTGAVVVEAAYSKLVYGVERYIALLEFDVPEIQTP